MMQLQEVELLKNKLSIIILAAGKGTRMNSDLPKVLHTINGKSMIEHVIKKTKKLNPYKVLVVVGYKHNTVKKYLSGYKLEYVLQEEQKGTGHAVMQCAEKLQNEDCDTLILSGDVPLITEQTLINLYETHMNNRAVATILGAKIKNPHGYGRIVRNENKIVSIVEEKDANQKEKNINEINAGIYIFNNNILFKNIEEIDNKNNQSEYYLPNLIPILIQYGWGDRMIVYNTDNENEIKGANTIEQLIELEKYAKTKKKN